MRVLSESVGFLPENGRFSCESMGNQAGKCGKISGFLCVKIVITLSDGKERNIQYIKASNYIGLDGNLMATHQFLEMLFGDLKGLVADEDQLRNIWGNLETRRRFMEQLREREYTGEVLKEVKTLVDAPDSDLFDVLGYVLFTNPPITREQRADNVEKSGLEDC